MSYITRDDGEHFVIPSYRDTLVVKQKSALKNEITNLSQNYGEFITLQEKGLNQYEVAFSSDTGYLLGESIWHYFKRPLDLVYCEAIPNTTEVILVIVKAGTVYLDGRFPVEGVSEELIVFLTQQINFDIYVYGDVPIAQEPTTGKFSFDPTSVKSFNQLTEPVFPILPLYKIYQLQLVDAVLKAHRIGVFPLRQLVLAILVAGGLYFLYDYLTSRPVTVAPSAPEVNPYTSFYLALETADPTLELNEIVRRFYVLTTLPGWQPKKLTYSKGSLIAIMTSNGGSVVNLMHWAEASGKLVVLEPTGISVQDTLSFPNRPRPSSIYPLKDTIAHLVDRIAAVYPGNHLTLGQFSQKQVYTEVLITVKFDNVSPIIIGLIADQLKGLPLTLQTMTFNSTNGNLSGSMIIQVLGN